MFELAQIFADFITGTLFGLDEASKFYSALNFFIYDSIKIVAIIIIVMFIMGIINHYLPIERIRKFLTEKKLYGLDYLLAALFGAITPFCSCSSVAIFIGFVRGGMPLGVSLTFLISSPFVDMVTASMFLGVFGWKITIIYIVVGIVISLIGGVILSKMHLEDQVPEFIAKKNKTCCNSEGIEVEEVSKLSFKQIGIETLDLIKSILPYILIGVAIGGIIHGYVPTGFFEKYLTIDNPLSVPIAVLAGIPMYTNTAGIIPIVAVLVEKGIPIGTAIAFMMAVVGLSLPEFLMLKKVMKKKLLFSFFGITAILMIISGYIFNSVL